MDGAQTSCNYGWGTGKLWLEWKTGKLWLEWDTGKLWLEWNTGKLWLEWNTDKRRLRLGHRQAVTMDGAQTSCDYGWGTDKL